MTASSIVEVKDGAGAYGQPLDGVDVTPGNTISIRLLSTTDVIQWALQIFGVDEITVTAPSLTGVNPSTHIVSTPSTVVTFTMPSGVGIARSLIFRSVVNGGGPGLSSTFGLYVRTGGGYRIGAVGEKLEGDDVFGWATTVNRIIRDAGAVPLVLPSMSFQQYAVLMENPGGTLVFQKLTEDMIDPGFTISSFAKTAPNAGTLTYRRGDSITGVSSSSTYVSGPPLSASIANSFVGSTSGGDINPGVWTINSPFAIGSLAGTVKREGSDLGSDPGMVVTLTANGTVSDQASFQVNWTRDVYYGVGVAGLITEVDIESLAFSVLSSTRVRTLIVSPSNQKVYYAYPKAYGTASFTLNGFPASFNTPSEVSVTNVNGVTSTYYVYESTNLLTGSNLNIVVS
jgi:hypothetical protein